LKRYVLFNPGRFNFDAKAAIYSVDEVVAHLLLFYFLCSRIFFVDLRRKEDAMKRRSPINNNCGVH
jgi:hypothetical protein